MLYFILVDELKGLGKTEVMPIPFGIIIPLLFFSSMEEVTGEKRIASKTTLAPIDEDPTTSLRTILQLYPDGRNTVSMVWKKPGLAF